MPDGSASTVLLFPATAEFAELRPLVVIWPGFGMGARYYLPLAEELAHRGFSVAIGELRGQGQSTARASFRDSWGYHDLASVDYPRTIQAAKAWFDLEQDHPTVLLTHSMGGQIGTLLLTRPEAKALNIVGMMGVGAGSPFVGAFPNPERTRLRIGGVVMRGLSRIIGFWPGGPLDITNYGRQSRVHIREWARFGRTNSLARLRGQDYDYMAAMQEVKIPVLLTRYSNDQYCTVASARALGNLIPKSFARVEEFPGDKGHNRWAREPEEVANRFEEFLSDISL